MNKIIKEAFLNSSATFLYVLAISLFMNWLTRTQSNKPDTFLAPLTFLMVFVFSAAFTGYFIFGRPTLMYLDGKKKEAVKVLTYTFLFLFIYTILAISIMLISTK